MIGSSPASSLASAQPVLRPQIFPTAVDHTALAGLSLTHLAGLYDATHTLMNVVSGLTCLPRFREVLDRSRCNAAGEQLALFEELAAACVVAIIDEAEDRVPADRDEALTREWLLARDGAIPTEDFAGFRALVEREAASVTGDAATGAPSTRSVERSKNYVAETTEFNASDDDAAEDPNSCAAIREAVLADARAS